MKYLEQSYQVSERHACCVLEMARATHRYEGYAEQWTELRMRIREIAQTRVRYGYPHPSDEDLSLGTPGRMIRVLLNREGWKVGKDLVYRLYKDEGLGLRKRPAGRRRAIMHRQERFKPTGPNQVWAMDFVSDQLSDGRRFRSLTVVDIYTREALAIESGQSLRGEDVVRVLHRLQRERGTPKVLFCDNGSEFTGQVDMWAYRNGVKIDFSRPGKPTDNAYCESFHAGVPGNFVAGVQRNLPREVSGHQLVPIPARSKAADRSLAAGIQCESSSQGLADRTPAEFASHIAASRDMTETKTGPRLTL